MKTITISGKILLTCIIAPFRGYDYYVTTKIFDTGKSVSEIACELGFKFIQHFSGSFKRHVGYLPNEYRMLN
ncbi:MAG TPA: helix-turn-helix domain-containing protein [Mucilaginibacter sp.]